MYFWHAWPRSDARRVRESDHWVSSEMMDVPYHTTSYSWMYPWMWIRILNPWLGVLWPGSWKPRLYLGTITYDLTQDPSIDSSFCRPFLSLIISILLSQPLLLNSLSAMNGCDRPLLNQLRSTVVSCRIFIRSQSLIARWTRNDFSLSAVARNFYEAFFIDEVSRWSKSYLFCTS